MTEQEILETLQNALKAAVLASVTPTLPIAFAGVSFEVPDDQKYIEPVVIFNDPVEYWGDERVYRGLFRLVLHWPKSGSGAYGPMNVLGSIGSYFTKELALQNLRITAIPAFTGSVVGEAETLYPSAMRFESFRT